MREAAGSTTTIGMRKALALVGALAVTAWASTASAQRVVSEPETGRSLEASAVTTIMLDPWFLSQADSSETYVIPSDVPGGGIAFSHPEISTAFAVAKTAPDGSLAVGCLTAPELAASLDQPAGGQDR